MRTHFWRYAALIVIMLLLSFVGSGMRIFALKEGLPAFNVAAGFLWALIYGILNIGLYRSFWEGLSGRPVGVRHLFWGFGLPSRRRLALFWAVISIPLRFLQPQLGPWVFPLALVFMVVGVGYAFSRSRRASTPALRTALGVFRKGRRRWLALPFLAALAMTGAGMLIALLVALALVLTAPLHLGRPGVGLLGMAIALPLTFALLVAMFPWLGGAMVAAAGNLAPATDNGPHADGRQ